MADPVMGPYHRGDSRLAVENLMRVTPPEAMRSKAYSLALAVSFKGDAATLRSMRGRGIRISALRGAYGLAAEYAVDYTSCLSEFLDDGMDPGAAWTVNGEARDILTRAVEVNGRPDVIRFLIGRGARCTPRSLAAALASGHEDAAYELLKSEPGVAARLDFRDKARGVLAGMIRVQMRVTAELREARDAATAESVRLRAEHDRFVQTEMPAAIAAAATRLSLENQALRRRLPAAAK
eukprot:jgi/Tetstr1/453909/TSEL_040828.t1